MVRQERDIQKSILAFLRGCSDVYVLNMPGSTMVASGAPDVICCIRGRFVAFEVKRDPNRYGLTGPQRVHFSKIRAAGGEAFVVSSRDDVEAVVERIRSL